MCNTSHVCNFDFTTKNLSKNKNERLICKTRDLGEYPHTFFLRPTLTLYMKILGNKITSNT